MSTDNQMEEGGWGGKKRTVLIRVIGARNNKWANTPSHNEPEIKLRGKTGPVTSIVSQREKWRVLLEERWREGSDDERSNMRRRREIRMDHMWRGGGRWWRKRKEADLSLLVFSVLMCADSSFTRLFNATCFYLIHILSSYFLKPMELFLNFTKQYLFSTSLSASFIQKVLDGCC